MFPDLNKPALPEFTCIAACACAMSILPEQESALI